jgi:hypothetical protein
MTDPNDNIVRMAEQLATTGTILQKLVQEVDKMDKTKPDSGMGELDVLKHLRLESLNLTQLKEDGSNFRVWFNDISHAAELLGAQDVLSGTMVGTPLQQRVLRIIIRSSVPQADKHRCQTAPTVKDAIDDIHTIRFGDKSVVVQRTLMDLWKATPSGTMMQFLDELEERFKDLKWLSAPIDEMQVAGVALTAMKDKPAFVNIRAELMSDPVLNLDKIRAKVRVIDNIAKMDQPGTGNALHMYGHMGEAGASGTGRGTYAGPGTQHRGRFQARGRHRGSRWSRFNRDRGGFHRGFRGARGSRGRFDRGHGRGQRDHGRSFRGRGRQMKGAELHFFEPEEVFAKVQQMRRSAIIAVSQATLQESAQNLVSPAEASPTLQPSAMSPVVPDQKGKLTLPRKTTVHSRRGMRL